MIVTINTDASFNHKVKIGSFAFWTKSNDFQLRYSGPLKGEIKHSQEAELKCVINALSALKKVDTSNVTKVIINTDCYSVIEEWLKPKRSKWSENLFKVLELLLVDLNLLPQNIEFRHVKAHNGAPDARSWVNDWCDQQAKKELNKLLTAN